MATSLAGGLYAIVDGIFVGRYLGGEALAAVNIVMPLIMMVESLANMVAVGTSVHIAAMLGKENRQEASQAFSFSVKFILLFSTMTALIGFYYAETVAAWLAPGADGEPLCLAVIASAIMGVVMNIFLLKYGGTSAVAAFAIVMYVDSIIGMLNFGLCESLQPALSYCYGAGREKRLQAIFQRILLASLAMAVAAFLFMELAGSCMAGVFIQTDDQNLVKVSQEALAIFAFSYLVGWIDLCFSSYFTALDMPARSLLVSFLGTLVFPIALLLVLTPVYGLTGIWMTAPIASALSGVVALLLYKNSRHKLIS